MRSRCAGDGELHDGARDTCHGSVTGRLGHQPSRIRARDLVQIADLNVFARFLALAGVRRGPLLEMPEPAWTSVYPLTETVCVSLDLVRKAGKNILTLDTKGTLRPTPWMSNPSSNLRAIELRLHVNSR